MSDVGTPTRLEHELHMETLVAAACRLVGSGTGVRSVHVLSPDRPTYEELLCYKEWAQQQHVRMNVDGNGITVRPEAAAEE